MDAGNLPRPMFTVVTRLVDGTREKFSVMLNATNDNTIFLSHGLIDLAGAHGNSRYIFSRYNITGSYHYYLL